MSEQNKIVDLLPDGRIRTYHVLDAVAIQALGMRKMPQSDDGSVEPLPKKLRDLPPPAEAEIEAEAEAETFDDGADLSEKRREVWNVLVAHPQGAHYTFVAEEVSVDANAVNARCCSLVNDGWAARVSAGVYRPLSYQEYSAKLDNEVES